MQANLVVTSDGKLLVVNLNGTHYMFNASEEGGIFDYFETTQNIEVFTEAAGGSNIIQGSGRSDNMLFTIDGVEFQYDGSKILPADHILGEWSES